MIAKPIETSVPVLPVFADRYSSVCFDPARPLQHEQIIALAEAARWAPSCHGDQPWRYVFCDRNSDPESWDKAFYCLLEKNQAWCKSAPLLIIACTDSVLSKTGEPNKFGAYDTGAASLALSLQAAALGLSAHQMGGFVPERAQELFHIPERFRPLTMMAVGYQLPASELPETFKPRELAERKRNPLPQNFFAGIWDNGLTP